MLLFSRQDYRSIRWNHLFEGSCHSKGSVCRYRFESELPARGDFELSPADAPACFSALLLLPLCWACSFLSAPSPLIYLVFYLLRQQLVTDVPDPVQILTVSCFQSVISLKTRHMRTDWYHPGTNSSSMLPSWLPEKKKAKKILKPTG